MDENIFRHLCPGKEKWIGHKEWVRRTLDAVEIFGRGQVCTQVIGGVELAKPYGFSSLEEALESNFQACDFFARHGVSYLSVIWHPHKASRLGFQPVPPLEYYIRLAKGLHEIRRSYGLVSTNDDYKRCGNHPDSDLERLDCMLRLPEKTPLPQTVSRLLEDKNSKRLIQVPGEKPGEIHAFLCQSLTSLDGSTLLLSLDRERTPLGRGWFGACGSTPRLRLAQPRR